MQFPWYKYNELPLSKRNTLQVFITNRCNLRCEGCFARKVMLDQPEGALGYGVDISEREYTKAIQHAIYRGAKQINILGGEPFLHAYLSRFCGYNKASGLKTTIYTNGTLLDRWFDLHGAKIRVSIYGLDGDKGMTNLSNLQVKHPFDANFMVRAGTTVEEMLEVAGISEEKYKCNVFFIFSMRECDCGDFFSDTERTMPVLQYKELVHKFLYGYSGKMEIHISKRGVFESTLDLPHRHCKFANYLIGGKIIQCPYDVVNLKYQSDYEFGVRDCQQNNTCLMSKIKLACRTGYRGKDE